MCYGDSTLEHVADGGSRDTLEHGYESDRMCRDFNAVLDYAWERNVVKIGDLPKMSHDNGGRKAKV